MQNSHGNNLGECTNITKNRKAWNKGLKNAFFSVKKRFALKANDLFTPALFFRAYTLHHRFSIRWKTSKALFTRRALSPAGQTFIHEYIELCCCFCVCVFRGGKNMETMWKNRWLYLVGNNGVVAFILIVLAYLPLDTKWEFLFFFSRYFPSYLRCLKIALLS